MKRLFLSAAIVAGIAISSIASPADDAFKQAESLRKNGQLQEAVKVAVEGLAMEPDDFNLNSLAGELYFDLGQYQDALGFYEKALEKKSKDADALYGAGMSSLKLGQYKEASEYFERGLRHKKARFLYGLGAAQLELGNYAEADLNLRKAIDKEEKVPIYHWTLGEINYRNKVWSIAITEFKKAMELDPQIEKQYPDTHYKIAESYLQLRNLDSAIAELRKDLEVHPKDTTAWLKLGNITQIAEKYSESAFCYEKYLEIVPGDGNRWFILGQTYLNLRDQEKAAAAFERAVSLNTKVPESFGYLASIYSDRKEYEKAWDAYARYERAMGTPDSVQYWFDKGKVAIKLGTIDNAYFDSALACFRKTVDLDSTFSSGYEYAGLSMYYKRDYSAAVPYFKTKIELDSSSVNSYRNLAFCYLKLEKYGEAAASFEKALALKPDDAPMRTMLGKIYAYNARYDRAVGHFELLLKDYSAELNDSLRCVIYPDLGLSYLKLKKCTQAIPILLDAERCSPREISILFNIGTAYEMCNRVKEANTYYRKVLAIDPNNQEAKKREMQTHFQGQE